jgi:hypothetical protein
MKYTRKDVEKWARQGNAISAQVVLDLLDEIDRLNKVIDFELLGLGVISREDLALEN